MGNDAMSTGMPRPSALDRLNVFIGRWLTEGETVLVEPGPLDLVLSLAVAATTLVSGLTYLVRWARILARSEQAL